MDKKRRGETKNYMSKNAKKRACAVWARWNDEEPTLCDETSFVALFERETGFKINPKLSYFRNIMNGEYKSFLPGVAASGGEEKEKKEKGKEVYAIAQGPADAGEGEAGASSSGVKTRGASQANQIRAFDYKRGAADVLGLLDGLTITVPGDELVEFAMRNMSDVPDDNARLAEIVRDRDAFVRGLSKMFTGLQRLVEDGKQTDKAIKVFDASVRRSVSQPSEKIFTEMTDEGPDIQNEWTIAGRAIGAPGERRFELPYKCDARAESGIAEESGIGNEFPSKFLGSVASGKISIATEVGLTASNVYETLRDVGIIIRAARAKTDEILAGKLNLSRNAVQKIYEPQGGSFVYTLRSLGASVQRIHSEHSLGARSFMTLTFLTGPPPGAADSGGTAIMRVQNIEDALVRDRLRLPKTFDLDKFDTTKRIKNLVRLNAMSVSDQRWEQEDPEMQWQEHGGSFLSVLICPAAIVHFAKELPQQVDDLSARVVYFEIRRHPGDDDYRADQQSTLSGELRHLLEGKEHSCYDWPGIVEELKTLHDWTQKKIDAWAHLLKTIKDEVDRKDRGMTGRAPGP